MFNWFKADYSTTNNPVVGDEKAKQFFESGTVVVKEEGTTVLIPMTEEYQAKWFNIPTYSNCMYTHLADLVSYSTQFKTSSTYTHTNNNFSYGS